MQPDLGDGDQEQQHDERAQEPGHQPRTLALAADQFVVVLRSHATHRSTTTAPNRMKRYRIENANSRRSGFMLAVSVDRLAKTRPASTKKIRLSTMAVTP